MTEAPERQRRRLRLGPLLRVVLPALFTLVLIVLLLFTMFFTEFDWQWVTFLGGILFASVLSLVSSTWKSGWRMARRTAETAHAKQRLSAEIQQHRGTREQLERELALHQLDRTRLGKEVEAHHHALESQRAAENMLALLELHLDEIAFYIDRSRRFRFHTRKFSALNGVPPERIDGFALEDALLPRNAEALRAHVLDALDGRAARAELSLTRRDGSEQRFVIDCFPQRDAASQVGGALVLLREALAPVAAEQQETSSSATDAAPHGPTELLIADESGNAVYLSSLTEELSGWGNPRERILQAIQNDGFDLYAQDIVALGKDTPIRAMHELLIRMRDEEQNMVPPGTFLPIAERFNMMPEIDRFVVRKAIAARAAKEPAPDTVLCINLARASLEDRAFPGFVARALEKSGVPGKALCFEIADRDAIASLTDATRLARELKPLGCRFALDGFGRAGIGFEHVKALPLDFLKIDGSIILQILRVPEALSKVRAIQRVSKVIGVLTIAEMVESDDVLERLRLVGVDYAQGFGIAKPQLFSQGTD